MWQTTYQASLAPSQHQMWTSWSAQSDTLGTRQSETFCNENKFKRVDLRRCLWIQQRWDDSKHMCIHLTPADLACRAELQKSGTFSGSVKACKQAVKGTRTLTGSGGGREFSSASFLLASYASSSSGNINTQIWQQILHDWNHLKCTGNT